MARDSAGVAIVESARGSWTERTAWRVSAEPAVDVGVEEGAPEYQLDRVRDALRMGDGRIVVANGGTQELRFYSATGEHLASVGRQGGGPGEYQGLQAVRLLPGDSLLAYDNLARRVSWLDPRGTFVRSVSIGEEAGSPRRFVDVLGDGTLLLSRSDRQFGNVPPQGLTRDTLTYLRFHPATQRADSLATFPGGESVINVQMSGGQITGMNILTPPFLRAAVAAAFGDGFVVGVNDGYTLERRRADGALERIIRRSHQPAPIDGTYLDSLRRVRARTDGDEAARAVAEAPRPATLPAFTRLLEDPDGNLWVETFAWPGDVEPRWEVFGAEGRLLGSVTVPPRFRPTQVGRDFVLGVWSDDVDVQHVRLFALEKP